MASQFKFLSLLFILFCVKLSSSQIVEEQIQLDTITETIKVIYRPSSSNSYYEKKIAVFANDTSQVAIEKTYARGVQNGIYKAYYPSGRLKVKAVFANGKMNGEFTWYQPDGVIYVKGVYKEGIKHGYWAYKYLKRYGRYKNGKRNRMWYTPDVNNKKIRSHYKDGVLVKGPGFDDGQMVVINEVKKDTSEMDSVELQPNDSIDKFYSQVVDFLANNAVFRKTIKTYFKKDIQKFKKNYKQDVLKFKVAQMTPQIEITSFLNKSKSGKIDVAVIDYILKNNEENLKKSFNEKNINIEPLFVEKSTDKEAEVTVFSSNLNNNLLRLDVVWNSGKEIKTSEKTFKILLYFNDNGILKGAEYLN